MKRLTVGFISTHIGTGISCSGLLRPQRHPVGHERTAHLRPSRYLASAYAQHQEPPPEESELKRWIERLQLGQRSRTGQSQPEQQSSHADHSATNDQHLILLAYGSHYGGGSRRDASEPCAAPQFDGGVVNRNDQRRAEQPKLGNSHPDECVFSFACPTLVHRRLNRLVVVISVSVYFTYICRSSSKYQLVASCYMHPHGSPATASAADYLGPQFD